MRNTSGPMSFTKRDHAIHSAQREMITCERVRPTHFAGTSGLICAIYHFAGDDGLGEMALYDEQLNRFASTEWMGTCFDVLPLPDENATYFIAAGSSRPHDDHMPDPMLRSYELRDGEFQLQAEATWRTPESAFGAVKSLAVADFNGDGQPEVLSLSVVEGKGQSQGYAQLKLWDHELKQIKSVTWEIDGGTVNRWGSRLAVADLNGDGAPEIVTVVDYRRGSNSHIDLRVFGPDLLLRSQNQPLSRERHFSTGLAIHDLDGDGKPEVVIVGGAFPKVRTGGTSEILVLDAECQPKHHIEWRTFRHSWVWDLDIADVDGDGSPEIVTFGGTAMDGTTQRNAHTFSEIRVWDASLECRDIGLWQTDVGLDTRASRGCVIPGDTAQVFCVTSRWMEQQRQADSEVWQFGYRSVSPAQNPLFPFIDAWHSRDQEGLASLVSSSESQFQALAVAALAEQIGRQAVPAMLPVLETPLPSLFRRAVAVLRHIGGEASFSALEGTGFVLASNWRLLGPFDNSDRQGFDAVHPAEASVDLEAIYAGKGRLVRWLQLDDRYEDAYLDLGHLSQDPFERTGIERGWTSGSSDASAYALTHINVPAPTDAMLCLGSTDSIKAWLNGEAVFSIDTARDVVVDTNRIPVRLRLGSNQLLMKFANHTTGHEWGFYCRVTGSDGRPLTDLSYVPPEVSFSHGQMIAQQELLALLDAESPEVQLLAAEQLVAGADARGEHKLGQLLVSEHAGVRARACLAMARRGHADAVELLVQLAPSQDAYFQLEACHVLQQLGDPRADRFALENLRGERGESIGQLRIEQDNRNFNVLPRLHGREIGNIRITRGRQFHFGGGVHASCASIGSFGLYASQYRGRGIGSRLMKMAAERMAADGVACSTVGTGTKLVAHRLYRQYGYVDRRFPWQYSVDLDPGMASREARSGVVLVPYADTLADDIAQLRQEYVHHSIGPVDRPANPSMGPWIRVIQRDGESVGYVETGLDPFRPVGQISALYVMQEQDAPWIAQCVLPQLHQYFLGERRTSVEFNDPAEAFRTVLTRCGYRLNPGCIRHGWVNMLKIVHLPTLLRQIAGLLTHRFQESIYVGWTGTLAICGDDRLQATLVIEDDAIQVQDELPDSPNIRLVASDATITQLVSGNADVWECYRQMELSTQPGFGERVRYFVEALFPRLPWRHWGWW